MYDCFYSTGARDRKEEEGLDESEGKILFENMVSEGVKINFEEFLEIYWNKK